MGIFDWLFGKQLHPDNKINKNGMNVYFENISINITKGDSPLSMMKYKDIKVCRLKVNKKEGRRHGQYESFDRDGNKIIVGNYKKGKLHGVIQEWRLNKYGSLVCCTIETWENGYLKYLKQFSRNRELIREEKFEQLTLEKGIIHIEIEQMDKFLNIKEEKPYETTIKPDEDGNLPGIDITDMLNDSINDKKEIQKLYHENGKIKQEFYVVNGQIEGLVKVYNEKGNLIEKGDFFNNKEQGNWEFYHENGKLKQKGNFKDGKHIGPWKFYHENGKIKQEGNYNENDRFEGTWKLYYPSGKLEQEIFYSDGIENGIYKDYYENGQLQKELLMENGKQVSIVSLYDESGKKIISKTDLE